MTPAIKIENLSKLYRLGVVGGHTLREDLQRWWWRVRGKGDPLLKVGQENRLDSPGGDNYVWALRDINLTVEQSQVLGIIGKIRRGKIHIAENTLTHHKPYDRRSKNSRPSGQFAGSGNRISP